MLIELIQTRQPGTRTRISQELGLKNQTDKVKVRINFSTILSTKESKSMSMLDRLTSDTFSTRTKKKNDSNSKMASNSLQKNKAADSNVGKSSSKAQVPSSQIMHEDDTQVKEEQKSVCIFQSK